MTYATGHRLLRQGETGCAQRDGHQSSRKGAYIYIYIYIYISIYIYTAYVSIHQHTSAYVSIRQHKSAYVSIRQHTSEAGSAQRDGHQSSRRGAPSKKSDVCWRMLTYADVCRCSTKKRSRHSTWTTKVHIFYIAPPPLFFCSRLVAQNTHTKKVQALDMNDKCAALLDTCSRMTHSSMRTHVCKLRLTEGACALYEDTCIGVWGHI